MDESHLGPDLNQQVQLQAALTVTVTIILKQLSKSYPDFQHHFRNCLNRVDHILYALIL